MLLRTAAASTAVVVCVVLAAAAAAGEAGQYRTGAVQAAGLYWTALGALGIAAFFLGGQLRRCRQALSASQERCRILVDGSPACLCALNERGEVLETNATGERMLGLSPERMIGVPYAALWPEGARPAVEQALQRALSGKGAHLEATGRAPDGKAIELEVWLNPIGGPDGRVHRVAVVAVDATQRRRIEQSLRQSEAQLRAVMEHSPAMITIKDTRGRILLANPQARSLEVPHADDVVGRHLSELFPVETYQRLWGIDTRAMRDGKPIECELTLHHRDHTEHTYLAVKFPLRGADGVVFGVGSILTDITPRRQAAQALCESENRLRSIVESAPLGIITLTPDGAVSDWNPAAEQIFGYRRQEAVGRPLQIVCEPDQASQAHLRQRVVAGARLVSLEGRFARKSGEVIDVSYSLAPISDAEKRIAGIVALMTDVTARRQVERRLWRLSKAMEQSPVSIVITDVRGRVEYVNPRFSLVTGYAMAEVAGVQVRSLKGGLVAPECGREMWEAVLAGREWHGEFYSRRKNNQRYWERASISPIRDEQGEVTHLVAVKEDITAQKQATDAMRQSEAKLWAITATASDAIIMLDNDGCVSFWNPAAERILGWSEREMIGRDLHACIVPDESENAFAAGFGQFRCTGSGPAVGRTLELFARRRDGRRVPVEVSISAMQLDGRWHAVGVLRDISERKQSEETRARRAELEQERNHLRDSVRSMEQVIGVLGHELRTPLAGMRALAELLLDAPGADAGSTQGVLDSMHGQIVRMADMVNNMLEVTRLRSGLANWKWGPVDVLAECSGALNAVRPLVDSCRVTLSCEVDPASLAMQGDADAIRRLLVNFLSNAVRSTDDGEIAVSAAPESDENGRWVTIEVSDTGEGIPPDIAAKLGEAFALNSGVIGEDHVKGSGLGLAICRAIVAAHAGELSVKSAAGQGTQIRVRLRADLDEPAEMHEVEIRREIES